MAPALITVGVLFLVIGALDLQWAMRGRLRGRRDLFDFLSPRARRIASLVIGAGTLAAGLLDLLEVIHL